MIKQSMPLIEKEDFDYIEQIVKTGQIAKGEFVEALQIRMSQEIGVRRSFATSSGTAALHLALLSLGIKEGDEVIIPSYACTALLSAVNYVKAIPVLADIDPETFNLTPSTIKSVLSKKTKAVVVTHTFGFPADLDGILKLGIPVVEDCAHSLGALYKRKATGVKGKVSVFSLYATKMLSAGEGGMICTNDLKLAERISDLNDPDMRDDYHVRYNYKMSDLTAGLALSQLRKLKSFIERRVSIALRYKESFSLLPVTFQKPLPGTNPNYYRFIICTLKPKKIIKLAQSSGLICDRPIFKPLHNYLSIDNNAFPGTALVWDKAISVPVYPALKDEQIVEIIDILLMAFKKAESSASSLKDIKH